MDDKMGLGKGLSAIFSNFQKESNSSDIVAVELPIENIEANPKQPRRVFDEQKMQELTFSIQREGILQPILVRKILRQDADIAYQIIAGERRWRAAVALNFKTIPAVVVECEDYISIQLGLIENLQRDDLNAIEEARSIKILIDEYHKTQEEVAVMISKSRSYVANVLRLLRLPLSVQQMVETKQISASHARTILESPDPEKFAQDIIKDKMNVREAEKLVKTNNSKKRKSSFSSLEPNNDLVALEQKIGRFFQARTKILIKDNFPILQISFSDFNEFDGFIDKLSQLSI